MMQTALRSRLLTALSASVGTRVDWDARPQAKGLPCVTLSLASDVRDSTMGGAQVTLLPFVQIDVWADTSNSAHTIANTIVSTLRPAATVGGVRLLGAPTLTVSSTTEDTPTGMVHRVMVRGIIAHTIP